MRLRCLLHREVVDSVTLEIQEKIYSMLLEVAFFKSYEIEREFCKW